MRRPTARMTPNSVLLRRVARWSADAAAGRVPEFDPPAGPFACAVQPASAEDVPLHMREESVIYYLIKFYDDPALRPRDEVLWDGRTLVVTGLRSTSGGAGRSHLVDAEERPVHAARP